MTPATDQPDHLRDAIRSALGCYTRDLQDALAKVGGRDLGELVGLDSCLDNLAGRVAAEVRSWPAARGTDLAGIRHGPAGPITTLEQLEELARSSTVLGLVEAGVNLTTEELEFSAAY